MKVFISWSGDHARTVGHALAEFLEYTFASHVETFFSDDDVAPGIRFLASITSHLSDADLGIVVVTRANRTAPWLLFEAGSLAARSIEGNVIPLLVDLERGELESPLDQFQNVLGANRDSIEKLCDRIWSDSGQVPLAPVYRQLLEQAWPALDSALTHIPEASSVDAIPKRETSDVINEILLGVNELVRRGADGERTNDSWAWTRQSVRDNGDMKVSKGTRLRHVDFGKGTVMDVQGQAARRIAIVKFDSGGTKKLLVKVAPIELLDG